MRSNFSGGWTQNYSDQDAPPERSRPRLKRRDATPQSALGAYVPPNSIEAEQSTLGAMLIESNSIDMVGDYLDLDDFYRESHRTIFSVVVDLHRKGVPVDLITVQEELKNRDKLESIGGISYLTSLFETVPTAANCLYYAKIVQEKALLRELIRVALEIIGMARGEIDDVNDVINQAERAVLGVSAARRRGAGPVRLKDIVAKIAAPDESEDGETDPDGATVDISFLPSLANSVKARKGRLILIGARPSTGKTSLSLMAALSIARSGEAVIYFSLELPVKEIVTKLLASMAEVNFDDLADKKLSIDEWIRVQQAAAEIEDLPLYFDAETRTVQGMRAVCRHYASSEEGLGAFFVDYLQRMPFPRRFDKNMDAVNYICNEFKNLATDLNIAAFVASQLNRSLEKREDQRPTKADLREGGEEPADVVILIHRPKMKAPKVAGDREKPGSVEEADLIIDKQRNGAVGAVRVGFKADFAKFVELEGMEWQFNDRAPTGF